MLDNSSAVKDFGSDGGKSFLRAYGWWLWNSGLC
jgi:hypothetical protein